MPPGASDQKDNTPQYSRRLLHCGISDRPLTAVGQERTSPVHLTMSALPPQSGQSADMLGCPLSAKSGCEQSRNKVALYSITSSARASSVGGTSMPSALAVPRLMTSSNLVARSINSRILVFVAGQE